MTKLGHLRMADLTAAALGTGPDFWLRAGSVMPDILMTTYCRGHTFRGRRESTARALAGLVRRRELGPLARFRLGWQLHYLEDFFTHPHNESFGGTLADHRRYELKQEALLLAHPPRPAPGPRAVPPPGREEELAGWLDALHAAYGAEAPGPETDLRYAAWAARGVARLLAARAEERLAAGETAVRAWGVPAPLRGCTAGAMPRK